MASGEATRAEQREGIKTAFMVIQAFAKLYTDESWRDFFIEAGHKQAALAREKGFIN